MENSHSRKRSPLVLHALLAWVRFFAVSTVLRAWLFCSEVQRFEAGGLHLTSPSGQDTEARFSPKAAANPDAFVVVNDVNFQVSPKIGGDQDTVGFRFADCRYVVKGKRRQDKLLLHGVSAHIAAGGVLATMGPSGAGKTTLLNMLTFEKGPGVASGSVTLGPEPFTYRSRMLFCSVVPQTD